MAVERTGPSGGLRRPVVGAGNWLRKWGPFCRHWDDNTILLPFGWKMGANAASRSGVAGDIAPG